MIICCSSCVKVCPLISTFSIVAPIFSTSAADRSGFSAAKTVDVEYSCLSSLKATSQHLLT
jgi:hypothetical protein